MRKYHLHVTLIALGTILYFMANFQRVAIPGAIFDTLQLDLHLTAPFVTAFGAAFMYVYAFSLLIIGILVDKFGGIKTILWGGFLFSIGAMLFSCTTNLPLLYIARGILGFGAASFYLSLVKELKKCFPDKYFGIAISIVLLMGNLGGVCANAPFVLVANKFGWRECLSAIGFVTFAITLIYTVFHMLLNHIPENKKVHFSLEPFREVFSNSHNIQLFIFGSLNYGLYYVIQTVIGVKFLKDFTNLSSTQASSVLSVMVIIAALSGICLATASKLCHNKRVIFMKTIAIMACSIFAIISLCLVFDFRTKLIAILLIMLAICGGMSPLLIPTIHGTNKYEIRGTALSIMNCNFFLSVGILGSIIGFLLELFPAVSNIHGHTVYGNNSYLCVFLMFFILSIVEINSVRKLKDVG